MQTFTGKAGFAVLDERELPLSARWFPLPAPWRSVDEPGRGRHGALTAPADPGALRIIVAWSVRRTRNGVAEQARSAARIALNILGSIRFAVWCRSPR